MANMIGYNNEYYNWQKQIGIIGGKLNKFKFEKEVKETDVLMDFGCGGGYLLKELICKEKHGVEINPAAAKESRKNKIKIFKSSSTLKKIIIIK